MRNPATGFLLLVLLCLAAAPLHLKSEYRPPSLEYRYKAAFILHFCLFTTWKRPQKPDDPFIISLLGTIPPGKQIAVPSDRKLGKHPVVVRNINTLAEINGSHVLFIYPSETYRLETILEYIKDKDILSVADTEGFGQKGVMINIFSKEDETIRFEFHHTVPAHPSLKFHSQIFAMGKQVMPQKGKK